LIDVPLASPKEAAALFQQTFLSLIGSFSHTRNRAELSLIVVPLSIGVCDRWSLNVHVVNKWSAVIRCLAWSTSHQHLNGYRTTTVCFYHCRSLVSVIDILLTCHDHSCSLSRYHHPYQQIHWIPFGLINYYVPLVHNLHLFTSINH
jgi:hypothetical protein